MVIFSYGRIHHSQIKDVPARIRSKPKLLAIRRNIVSPRPPRPSGLQKKSIYKSPIRILLHRQNTQNRCCMSDWSRQGCQRK
jgi:hypothetical protein